MELPSELRTSPPWERPEIAANAIISADVGARHPGLCFEFGDHTGEQFIPHEVVNQVLWFPQFAVALWQAHNISLIDVRHTPERSNASGLIASKKPRGDTCTIRHYKQVPYGAYFCTLSEGLDPRPVCRMLNSVLREPLGQPLRENEFLKTDPILRIVIEFPGYRNMAQLPLDTSIGSLALLASQEYIDMTC